MTRAVTGKDEFDRLVDVALKTSEGDHTFVSLSDRSGGTARFANNQIVQNVDTRRHTLSVTVALGQRTGTATTTSLSTEAVEDAVKRATTIARLVPEDPEHLPPLPQQPHVARPVYAEDTAEARPRDLVRDAARAIDLCKKDDLVAAGIVAGYVSAHGVAADTGLRLFETRTRADFSLTATGPDSSGWVKNANRSLGRLGVGARTRVAIDKAKRSANPKEVPAGRYTVILDPAAVAGLLGPLARATRAKPYHRGTSALSGKLGQGVIDPRLTLRNAPDHDRLLGDGFSGAGLPSDEATWIEDGVWKRLDYDRFSAKEHGTDPTYPLDAPHLSGAGAETRAALIEGTERGILVTNFWYIRFVNPRDLTLTGMTRDGTFLIENGEVTGGLINFRWHESPLRAFNQVEGFTEPEDAITVERTKMLLPTMKIRDFNFSSVTRF